MKDNGGNGKNYRPLNDYNGNGSNGSGLTYFVGPGGVVELDRKKCLKNKEGFRDSITKV